MTKAKGQTFNVSGSDAEKIEVAINLNQTMDAEVWTKEFMRIWGNKLNEVDHDLMRAWFANSIMCGYDIANQRRDANQSENVAALLALLESALANGELQGKVRWQTWVNDARQALKKWRGE